MKRFIKKRGIEKINKKAFSQVDWAISLGIFLLFLVWFFVFVTPNFSKTVNSDALVYIVESKISQFYWNVYKIPVFIKLDKIYDFGTLMPFFVPLKLDTYNYSFDSGLLETAGDSAVFLANLTKKLNIFWLVKGVKPGYINNIYDLVSTFSTATILTEHFKAFFDKGLFETAEYKAIKRLDNNKILINGRELNYTFGYESKKLFAKYNFTTNSFELSQIVFANNPGIYFYFNNFGSSGNLLNYTQKLTVYPYKNFYINNKEYGNVNYEEEECYNFTSDYLNLYDIFDGTVFVFSKPVSLSFCAKNEYISLSFTYIANESLNYKIVFYSGNYLNGELYRISQSAKVGVPEVLKGFSLDLLKSYDFSNIKRKWGFPEKRDFKIILYDLKTNETYFEYQTSPIDVSSNVYAKEENDYILYDNGSIKRVMLSIMTW